MECPPLIIWSQSVTFSTCHQKRYKWRKKWTIYRTKLFPELFRKLNLDFIFEGDNSNTNRTSRGPRCNGPYLLKCHQTYTLCLTYVPRLPGTQNSFWNGLSDCSRSISLISSICSAIWRGTSCRDKFMAVLPIDTEPESVQIRRPTFSRLVDF